jgi:hypothetical protein
MLPNFKSCFKLSIVIHDCCVRLKIPFAILGKIYTQRYGAYTIDSHSNVLESNHIPVIGFW